MNDYIEILAPAGNMDSLHAAVENGADAVYLGGKLFSARQNAGNFDKDELNKAVKYAHRRNVKIYVTVNTLLDDNEIDEILDYLAYLYNIDVDAVIVQDLGLIKLIKEILPELRLHASTQMTINNYKGVKFLEELGFDRVVLAREISLNEIKFIKEKTNIDLEAFVHGALCICYSGQCLMSSLIGGRSGNRGRCAQPCRMPYSIIKLDNKEILSKEFDNKYILSTKDLNTIDYLDDIIKSGITSLKVEGRMKKPEYVSIIVNKYKKALESLDNNSKLTQHDKKEILQIFNRGFTKGYILNDNGKDIISLDRPDNRGIYIGSIDRIDHSYMYINLIEDLKIGDGIRIVNQGTEKGMVVRNLFQNGKAVKKVKKGYIAQIKKITGVQKFSKVLKTLDCDLIKKARNSYIDNLNHKKINIHMSLDVSIGKKIKLYLWDDKGNYISVKGSEKVEKARNISLTKEKVINQMSKLGSTPYHLENIELKLEDNSFVSISTLNDIRRKSIDLLDKKRENFNNRCRIYTDNLSKKADKLLDFRKYNDKGNKRISVKINSFNQLKYVNLNRLDRIYLNFTEGLFEVTQEIKKYDIEVYWGTGRIIGNDKFEEFNKLLDKIGINSLTGISVSNLGTLKYVKDMYDTEIHCDIGLNIFNSYALKLLSEHGVGSATLSPELKLNQIDNIYRKTQLLCETIVYGYLPVMITKYCPLSLINNCNTRNDCNKCKYNSGYGLLDRKNMIFKFDRKNDNTIIYNSRPLVLLEDISKILLSTDIIRLDFTSEESEIIEVQDVYYEYLNKRIEIDKVRQFVDKIRQDTGITKGHYFRGVL